MKLCLASNVQRVRREVERPKDTANVVAGTLLNQRRDAFLDSFWRIVLENLEGYLSDGHSGAVNPTDDSETDPLIALAIDQEIRLDSALFLVPDFVGRKRNGNLAVGFSGAYVAEFIVQVTRDVLCSPLQNRGKFPGILLSRTDREGNNRQHCKNDDNRVHRLLTLLCFRSQEGNAYRSQNLSRLSS